MDSVLEIKRFDEFSNVSGVGVHVVAVHCLSGTTVPAAIMSDYPETALQKKHHLGIPVVSGQWPTMMKKKRLTTTPIFVVNLRPIFRRNYSHVMFSFFF